MVPLMDEVMNACNSVPACENCYSILSAITQANTYEN